MSELPQIAEAYLIRIESDVGYAVNRADKTQVITRFGYDHGSLTMWTKSGNHALLFSPDGDLVRANAARILWQMSPTIIKELIRGYRLAKKAGLL